MAKTTTEKPTKAKLISGVKPKAPASKSLLQKVQKVKATTAEEAPAPSKKAEGKRKSAAVVSTEEGPSPLKKSKKASKAATEDDENATQVEAGKTEIKKGSKAGKSHAKKGKEVVVEGSDAEDSEAEAQSSQPKKSGKSADKSQKAAAPKTRSSKKATPTVEEDEDEENESAEEKEEGSDEEEAHLFGFSTDDADSSDDEMNADPDPIEVTKLPTIAKDDAIVKQKLEKAKKKPVCVLLLVPLTCSNVISIDRRPRCYLPRPDTPRFLRDSNESVFLPIRRRDASTIVS